MERQYENGVERHDIREYWIHLAPDRDQWGVPVDMVMNFLDPTE
jgi:hypothetical protein